MPGIVTLVSRRGEVQVDTIGSKTLGRSDPIRRDTIFRFAGILMTQRVWDSAGGPGVYHDFWTLADQAIDD